VALSEISKLKDITLDKDAETTTENFLAPYKLKKWMAKMVLG